MTVFNQIKNFIHKKALNSMSIVKIENILSQKVKCSGLISCEKTWNSFFCLSYRGVHDIFHNKSVFSFDIFHFYIAGHLYCHRTLEDGQLCHGAHLQWAVVQLPISAVWNMVMQLVNYYLQIMVVLFFPPRFWLQSIKACATCCLKWIRSCTSFLEYSLLWHL